MAAKVRTEIRIPTRSAPRPPLTSTRNVIWNSTNDFFESTTTQQCIQKKKPPPRPPPPKFNQNSLQMHKEKHKKPVKPTELLINLFGRKRNEHSNNARFNNSHIQNTVLQSENTNGSICLIDFSPPGSPTFTTRSSIDGVSIDSFGSDGNSNSSAFTSSGSTSQTESAFEDDFDFFGVSTKKLVQNDPWQSSTITDPFGPIDTNNYNTYKSTKHVSEGNVNVFNGSSKHNNNQVPFNPLPVESIRTMPTIIRTKPLKPPPPKILRKNVDQENNHFNPLTTKSNETAIFLGNTDLMNPWQNDSKYSPSPPMPTIPPPMPPLECLTEMTKESLTSNKEPYGLALYDFPLTQEGDLSFKEGDIINLIRKVNDDWMEGRIGNQQGIFPTNFIDIKVSLPDVEDNIVTAIYSFHGETTEDLSFLEGERITVLSRISENWMYGKCGERKGQFPANYVNRIPCNVPLSY